MFIRQKRVDGHVYLQLVENRWVEGKTRQRVVASLGRLDRLKATGQVDALLRSLARFSDKVRLQEAYEEGSLVALGERTVGPSLVFGRLWEELGIGKVLGELLSGRKFEFDVERAVFGSVLHRLFESGSDRQGHRFLRDVHIPEAEGLELHHLYRAMRFLGEERERIEEGLFHQCRDLFSRVRLVFFDTTSLFFYGEGGELGERGYSRDRRPELKQVVVGALLAEDGRPISCEVKPGGFSDLKALLPMVERAQERFSLGEVCFVADRGMVTPKIIEELIRAWGPRYRMAGRKEKTNILDEFVALTGYHRKSAVRLKKCGIPPIRKFVQTAMKGGMPPSSEIRMNLRIGGMPHTFKNSSNASKSGLGGGSPCVGAFTSNP